MTDTTIPNHLRLGWLVLSIMKFYILKIIKCVNINIFYRCGVYIALPYGAPEDMPILVASWTPTYGLLVRLPLFPDKFEK